MDAAICAGSGGTTGASSSRELVEMERFFSEDLRDRLEEPEEEDCMGMGAGGGARLGRGGDLGTSNRLCLLSSESSRGRGGRGGLQGGERGSSTNVDATEGDGDLFFLTLTSGSSLLSFLPREVLDADRDCLSS